MSTLPDQIKDLRTPRYTGRAKLLRASGGLIAVLLLVFVSVLVLRPASRDYISYWSAAKLLAQHTDPYSPSHVFALEKAHGDLATHPILMRNPPWTLFLVAPLALGGPSVTLYFWTLAAIGCLFLFARLQQVPSNIRAFAFVFAPAISAIITGQSSPFLLLGFALFLHFHQRRPFMSGAALLLMAIKPHLFLVFGAVLLADCIRRRRYAILAGASLALVLATGFALCFDPHVWQHYVAMMRGSRLDQEFFPTASMLFRLLIRPASDWLLFVPSALGIAWGLWYYARNWKQWDWDVHGMLLILVTVTVSPYGWFTDSIVLLPPIAFALASPAKRRHSAAALMFINTLALVVLLVVRAPITSPAYVWLPTVILLWFIYTLKEFPYSRRPFGRVANGAPNA